MIDFIEDMWPMLVIIVSVFLGAFGLAWHSAKVGADLYNKQCNPDTPITAYEIFWAGENLGCRHNNVTIEGD